MENEVVICDGCHWSYEIVLPPSDPDAVYCERCRRMKAHLNSLTHVDAQTEAPLAPGEFWITNGNGTRERCRYVGQSITVPMPKGTK